MTKAWKGCKQTVICSEGWGIPRERALGVLQDILREWRWLECRVLQVWTIPSSLYWYIEEHNGSSQIPPLIFKGIKLNYPLRRKKEAINSKNKKILRRNSEIDYLPKYQSFWFTFPLLLSWGYAFRLPRDQLISDRWSPLVSIIELWGSL